MLSFQKIHSFIALEQTNSTKLLLLRCVGVHGAAAVTHLTFGSNAYVSVDRCLRPQVDGLLDADISQGVFSKDRTSIKVGSHEATEARQSLVCKTKRKELRILHANNTVWHTSSNRMGLVMAFLVIVFSWHASVPKVLTSMTLLDISYQPSQESDTSYWWIWGYAGGNRSDQWCWCLLSPTTKTGPCSIFTFS